MALSADGDCVSGDVCFRRDGRSHLEARAFASDVRATTAEKSASLSVTSDGDTYFFISVGEKYRLPEIGSPAEFFDMLLDRHKEEFQSFYSRSAISIPDAKLAFLYKYSLYLLKSSSHPESRAIGLLGLYNDGKQSWVHYTNNFNTQLNYCNLLASNYPEYMQPYFRLFTDMLPVAKSDTATYFNASGVRYPAISGKRGYNYPGYVTVCAWLGSSAFVAHQFGQYYEYTQDEVFLRDQAFPVIRESLDFYCDILKQGTDGRLHLFPSTTPEDGEGSWEAFGVDCAMDLQFLDYLFGFGIGAAKTLGVDCAKWETAYSKLAAYPEKDGAIVELSDKTFEDSHRHAGVCAGIFPIGNLVSKDFAKSEKTFDRFVGKGNRLWVGFTYSWNAACAARLFRPEEVKENLDIFADWFCSQANMLHLNYDYTCREYGLTGEKVFTIEGNMIAGAAVLEMLLQSYDGVLRLFPAVPDSWEECSFERLRAVGGFEVSATKSGGVVTASILSLKGNRLDISIGVNDKVLVNGQHIEVKDSMLSVPTQPNESVDIQIR